MMTKRKYNVISILVALLMVLSTAIPSFAVGGETTTTVHASGKCGKHLTWQYIEQSVTDG